MSQLGFWAELIKAAPQIAKAAKDVRGQLKKGKDAAAAGNVAAASLAQKDADLIAAKQAHAIAASQPAAKSQIPTAYIIGGVAVLGIGAMLLMKR